MAQQAPLTPCRAVEKWSRMTSVANSQAPAGRKESSHNCCGKGSTHRHLGELPVEQTDELRLIQAVHEPPHEVAQIAGCRRDSFSVAGYVGQQQTGDTTCATTGGVIDIAATLRLSVGFAVDPGVEAPEFHAPPGELAASPHFHALHLLCRQLAHSGNIAWRRHFPYCRWLARHPEPDA